MSEARELPPLYNPHGLEEKWYPRWEKEQFFSFRKKFSPQDIERLKQEPSARRNTFSIVLPPPNVTGSLHLGHALNHTIQDILIRYHRMKGDVTLWIPGTDHAGIATQNVVERQLAAEGKSRRDFSRAEFEQRVWQWKAESGGMITHQMRQLGESVDWNYERFTMDEGLSFIVRRVFVRLYQEGLIYRGERMINWCPKDQTALSNIEVEFKETHGKLYFVKYPLKGGQNISETFLLVATTRPETIPGDEALAVHPEDERYRHLIGKKALLPVLGKEIPIIADSYVDREFGTGVVKITPAHDHNDFLVAQRHSLPLTNIMTDSAHMNELAGPYAGLSREECRRRIVHDMEAAGLLQEIKDIKHNVGHSYRSGAVVEPRLSTQWFVKVKPLAEKAIEAVKSGQTKFYPQRWENLYFDWLENIEDWCISRQLWWGHRIPAWHCKDCGHITVSESEPAACEKCGSSNIQQDEDVLDTWFSSGLWPFSTQLARDVETVKQQWKTDIPKSDELSLFYPTSVLVTGFDIIFFWVARMMMFGLHFMKEVPFRHVYMHGLVRDANRQKMSKSKGNVVNPLEKMEEYGTDAFRFFLMSILPEGKDIIFDESRLKGYQAFCNKIWNTARFIWMNQPADYTIPNTAPGSLTDRDHWILAEYNQAVSKATDALENYRFAEYAQTVYDFLWKSFCDNYVEMAKAPLKNPERAPTTRYVLNRVFENTLRLLHPIMPFITEELYSFWPRRDRDDLIIISEWPQTLASTDAVAHARVEATLEAVAAARRLRHELNIPPGEKIPAAFVAKTNTLSAEHVEILCTLARLSQLDAAPSSGENVKAVLDHGVLYLDVTGRVDVEREAARITKEIETLEKGLRAVQAKLGNPQFAEKAPAELVAAEKEKQVGYEHKLAELRELLAAIKK